MPKRKKSQRARKLGDNKLAIYQTKAGAIALRGDFSNETMWATQAQIANIFDIDRSVVSKHILNILKSKEVDEKSNVQKMHIPNSDKPVAFYSLDMILGVGYRANSARAISFRQWATNTLREHIVKGFTINRSVVKTHYAEFLQAVEDMKRLLSPGGTVDTQSILELVSAFADTWLSLEAYDEDKLAAAGATKKLVQFTADMLVDALAKFKTELRKKGEATDLFGSERQKESVAGIVGNVMQSFGGAPLYPTVEEKAAHLLYFIVKNHPFVDGNKRSGAYSFVWFLKLAGTLDTTNITPSTLTALTLLVAESDPKHKERMIRLTLQLLKH